MTIQQAKEILLLYRPGLAGDVDPETAAALALAKQDAELSAWLAEHCAMQTALRARFRQLPVPEGLKEQILSERRAYFALPFKRKVALVGLAFALMLIVAGLAKFYWPAGQDESFAAFRARIVGNALPERYPKMDLLTNDLVQIRQFLTKNQAYGDYQTPSAMDKAAATGCALLSWHDNPVSMICYKSGKKLPQNLTSDIFLFVIDRSAVSNPPSDAPQFGQVKQLATASWSKGNRVYVLAGIGDEAFLKQYL